MRQRLVMLLFNVNKYHENTRQQVTNLHFCPRNTILIHTRTWTCLSRSLLGLCYIEQSALMSIHWSHKYVAHSWKYCRGKALHCCHWVTTAKNYAHSCFRTLFKNTMIQVSLGVLKYVFIGQLGKWQERGEINNVAMQPAFLYMLPRDYMFGFFFISKTFTWGL